MKARDTSAPAEAAQLAAYRRMSGEQRVAIASNLSEDVREIARAGIRARHPNYDEEQVRFALFRMLLGDELFGRAWPEAPRLDP
jgi:hypothetical protein